MAKLLKDLDGGMPGIGDGQWYMAGTNMNISEAVKAAKATLEGIYDEREASAIAWVVLEYLTGSRRGPLLASKADALSREQVSSLERITRELKAGKPLQYVLGETEFYGLRLKVDPSVLIPRQETEELADWIIREARAEMLPAPQEARDRRQERAPGSEPDGPMTRKTPGAGAPLHILDIGTGSGCIAIALKKNLPGAEVWACDLSSAALIVAGKNAAMNQAVLNFRQADILDSSGWKEFPLFDIIVSNPPYVTLAEKREMPG
ncbi:MAG TPA: HemK/PrmC family methyltransferase, partial [Anseongella sp.]|nr:HemK/PrmC family methyltransferase [Anseongella sp.]